MDISKLTVRKATSLAILLGYHNYLDYLNYDAIDWQEWCWVNRN